MKTPDHISKKRQKLSQELQYWIAREQSVRTALSIQFEPTTEIPWSVDYCRKEAAKRRKDLEKLSNKTRWQLRHGWR